MSLIVVADAPRTKQTNPDRINWRVHPELRKVAEQAFLPLEFSFPVEHAMCVQFSMLLVHNRHPNTLADASTMLEEEARTWWKKSGHLVLQEETVGRKTMTVDVPVDGNFVRHAQGTMHLLRERKDLMHGKRKISVAVKR